MGVVRVHTPLVVAVLVAAATAAPVRATAARPSPHIAGRPVAVTLREYAIVLPTKLRPGLTTFVLRNRGGFPHDFTAIYGPVRFRSPVIAPGSMSLLTVRLVPGAYVVVCTLLDGGHLAEGMLTLFTIGSRSHGSGRWHYP